MRRVFHQTCQPIAHALLIAGTLLLGLIALPVSAQLSFEEFWLSSDVPVRVPDASSPAVTVTTDRSSIIIGQDGTGNAQVNGALFDQFGADLDALDRFPTRFSIDTARIINGVLIKPADVFFASGSNPPSLFFDADAADIPDGVNLDAVTQNPVNGNLVLSFDRFFEHPTLGFVQPANLIGVVQGQLDSIVFNSSSIPDGVNVDAAHWLTEDAMLLSFDVDVELPSGPGTLVFRDDDIVLVDLVSGSFDRVLSLANDSHPSWVAADLDALWAELAINAGAFRFSTSFREVPESIGTFDITVERIDGSESTVQARVTSVNGSAMAGSDFNTVNEVLSWADGDASSRTVTVTIINDSTEEDNPEKFSLQLAIESGEADLASPSTVQINILDNDGQNLFSDGFES